MTATGRTEQERRRLYRSGWLVVVFAITSYLLVAYAEQGSAGAGMSVVPNDPLPFARHSGVGIDLTGKSSLAALEWLEQADTGTVPFITVPIDGDIVAAFNNPDTFIAARAAVDQLVNATNGTPVAACLRRPVTAIEESIIAEAAVTALVENYTDQITYIGACRAESTDSWAENVLDVLNRDPASRANEYLLAPLSVGAPMLLQQPAPLEEMNSVYLDRLGGEDYVALRLPASGALDDATRQSIAQILHDRSHVAIFLAAPDDAVAPGDFVASLSLAGISFEELSEGFNNSLSPLIAWHGDWTSTEIGPVTYQQTQETGAWFTSEFIGTEIWAIGISSPDGGQLGIWVDADDPSATGDPDNIVDMSRTQALDQALPLIDGLPAARHQITVVAADGDIALSGLFVAGRPESGWHGVVGAIGLIVTTVAGLGIVLSVAVDDLRLRIGLDQRDDDNGEHPRVFKREV